MRSSRIAFWVAGIVVLGAGGCAATSGAAAGDEPAVREATGGAEVAEVPAKDGQMTPASGTYVGGQFASVSAGKWHTCAIDVAGEVACWGLGSDPERLEGKRDAGQAVAPSGRFVQVSAGAYHTCALAEDGRARCWGYGSDPQLKEGLGDFDQAAAPSGTFSQVVAGEYHSCGLRPDGAVVCWGAGLSSDRDEGFADADQSAAPAERFEALSAGARHTCGLRVDGTIRCWGDVSFDDGTFAAVASGTRFACGVRQDGGVACWGAGTNWFDRPAGANLASVSAGGFHACGVREENGANGALECWGLGSEPGRDELGQEGAAAVNRSADRSLRERVRFGPEDFDQADPPSGTWRSVSAGYLHTCGIRTSGEVVCWGANRHGQARPPKAGSE